MMQTREMDRTFVFATTLSALTLIPSPGGRGRRAVAHPVRTYLLGERGFVFSALTLALSPRERGIHFSGVSMEVRHGH